MPLAGFAVGVTAARRAADFAAMLIRNGATVLHAPAIRMIPLDDDAELRQATQWVLQAPPEVVVATTAVGFRGWLDAAQGWGQRTQLEEVFRASRLLARGPKTTGAIRAVGLREQWTPAGESSAEVVAHLVADGIAGVRIAVALHGSTVAAEYDICAQLRAAGAEVVAVPVYRWEPPEDLAPLDRLIESAVSGTLDAVTFTSAPAVLSMLGRANATGVAEELLVALRGPVFVACVGAVTAAPLDRLGVPTGQPARARLGALARYLVEELPARGLAAR